MISSYKCFVQTVFLFLMVGFLSAQADEFLLQNNLLAIRKNDGMICRVSDGQIYPLGQLVFQVSRFDINQAAMFQAAVREVVVRDGQTAEIVYDLNGDAADTSRLSAVYTLLKDRIRIQYTIGYNGPMNDLFKPRFRYVYSTEGGFSKPESARMLRRSEVQTIEMDYGPFLLNMDFKDGEFEWIGVGAVENLPMNLKAGHSLDDSSVWFELSLRDIGAEKFRQSLEQKMQGSLDDAQACLDAWKYLAGLEPLDALLQPGRDLYEELHEQRTRLLSKPVNPGATMELWAQASEISLRAGEVVQDVYRIVHENRPLVYAAAKARNDASHYYVGLSCDADPLDRLDKWALFQLNFFRASTEPRWMGMEDFGARTERMRRILDQAAGFGAKAVVGIEVGAGDEQPADLTFSHELQPLYRPSFYKQSLNSSRLRAEWEQEILRWLDALQDCGNVLEYKMGNEPFWSSHPSKVYGYGLSDIGCDEQTFRKKIIEQCGSFESWRTLADKSPQGGAVSWQSLDAVSLSKEAVSGLTFVEFLKSRYSSLENLNQAWFGRPEGFVSWSDVFPPFPEPGSVNGSESGALPAFDLPDAGRNQEKYPRPSSDAVTAWIDWTAYWPEAVNDRLMDLYQRAKNRFPEAKLSVNCITGQFLNNYLGAAVDAGLNPWITARGLDDLSIDFYSLSFMQAYLRALDCAAGDRPVIIQETGGSDDSPTAAYMTLFSFAHGADGLLFWRRDHNLAPKICLEIARARQALSDPDLQASSKPLTDGVAVLYSFDSLRVADAFDGSADSYLNPWQAGVLLLSKFQVLYDLYSDLDLQNGIPAHIKVLFCPSAMALSDQNLSRIEEFVNRGGRLVASSHFAEWNPAGQKRDPAAVQSLLKCPEVFLADTDQLKSLHDMLRNDHSPKPWGSRKAPAWAEELKRFIQQAAPNTVNYCNAAGDELYVLPAARVSNEALYVFVDPWAGKVSVQVPAGYSDVQAFYSGKTLEWQRLDDGRMSCACQGPEILKFTK